MVLFIGFLRLKEYIKLRMVFSNSVLFFDRLFSQVVSELLIQVIGFFIINSIRLFVFNVLSIG